MHDPNGKEWTFNWPQESNAHIDLGTAKTRTAGKQNSVLKVSSQPPLYAAKTLACCEQHHSVHPVLVHELPREVTHLRLWPFALRGFRASRSYRTFLQTIPLARYLAAWPEENRNLADRLLRPLPHRREGLLHGLLDRRTPLKLLHLKFRRLIESPPKRLLDLRDRDITQRLHLAHLQRCSARRRLTLEEICERMALHPHISLWVPDTLDLPVWSTGVDWGHIRGTEPSMGAAVAPPTYMQQIFALQQYGRVSQQWFTQETLGDYVTEPADKSRHVRSNEEDDVAAIQRIALLTSKDVCGGCPMSLLCVRGKPLYVNLKYQTMNRDFYVQRCYRCHCIAFSVSIFSKKLKPDHTMYVCPHLRHGLWSRAPIGGLKRPATASAHTTRALHGTLLERQNVAPIPGGCHEDCDYTEALGFNPDHPLNRLRKIQRQWPGYEEDQQWSDQDCISALSVRNDIPVEFR